MPGFGLGCIFCFAVLFSEKLPGKNLVIYIFTANGDFELIQIKCVKASVRFEMTTVNHCFLGLCCCFFFNALPFFHLI